MQKWISRDVLLISFSAFFADLGYQAVQALFPIFLVITLASSPLAFGIANALAFGGGAVLAYIGGVLSDRYSRKWIVVIGSAFILLMSAVGLATSPIMAVALFTGGWWGRNFRSPPRRAMLADVSKRRDLGKTFGLLHALDVGGGMLSVVFLVILLAVGVSHRSIFILTAIPITISMLLIILTSDIRKGKANVAGTPLMKRSSIVNRRTFWGIIIATALYGFSYYSLGFPILTITMVSSNSIIGVGSYGVYLGISAITGYWIGSRKGINKIKTLGLVGYVLSGIGTAVLSVSYWLGYGTAALYVGVAIMGFGLGVVETIEPTIISLIRRDVKIGKGMGALQGSRSFGVFFGNLVMGILYVASPSYSYAYAAAVSVVAGIIILYYGAGFRQ